MTSSFRDGNDRTHFVPLPLCHHGRLSKVVAFAAGGAADTIQGRKEHVRRSRIDQARQ